MNKKTIRDIDVKGKKVFVRVDFNVPMDEHQNITNDTRIRATLPTINYLLDGGAAVMTDPPPRWPGSRRLKTPGACRPRAAGQRSRRSH